MPTCSKCGKYVAINQKCIVCNTDILEYTIAARLDAANIRETQPLRPVRRSPTPRLVVLDDDSSTFGEIHRLRRTETRIGRHECDITIGNDSDISACHASIFREGNETGSYQWRLIDNNSTNGTYVRKSAIEPSKECFLFLGGVKMHWRQLDDKGALDIAVDGRESIRITPTDKRSYVIGRQANKCDIAIEDPTLDKRHAVLRWENFTWWIEDQGSLNGIWGAIRDYVLSNNSLFLLGEQRFLFQMPHSPEEC